MRNILNDPDRYGKNCAAFLLPVLLKVRLVYL